MNPNLEQALIRLESFRVSNRLIRKEWVSEDEGKETACLLAALSKEVGIAESPSACPAELLDPWFAHLTPWFDDAGSEAAWPAMVARYGGVVKKLMSLPAERRTQLDYASRAIIVREAMRYTSDKQVLASCETVAVLCEGVASGMPRDDEAFEKAAAAEEATARAASTARAAARAAAAAAAAGATARAAAAAAAAGARAAAEAEAAEAAAAAAADRITVKIFDLIEAA
jgi:hypothetical protein